MGAGLVAVPLAMCWQSDKPAPQRVTIDAMAIWHDFEAGRENGYKN